jgi:hypothetical protein
MRHLYRISERFGCTFEDGSDNIRYGTGIVLYDADTQEQVDDIGEQHAEMYGSQDYAYRFHAVKLAELTAEDIECLKHELEQIGEDE